MSGGGFHDHRHHLHGTNRTTSRPRLTATKAKRPTSKPGPRPWRPRPRSGTTTATNKCTSTTAGPRPPPCCKWPLPWPPLHCSPKRNGWSGPCLAWAVWGWRLACWRCCTSRGLWQPRIQGCLTTSVVSKSSTCRTASWYCRMCSGATRSLFISSSTRCSRLWGVGRVRVARATNAWPWMASS